MIDAAPGSGVRRVMAEAGYELLDGPVSPVFNVESLSAALVDRAGSVVAASSAFRKLHGEAYLEPEALARAALGGPPILLTTAISTEDDQAQTAVFAYALAAHAKHWALPPVVRDAAAIGPGHVVVLTSLAVQAARPLEDAGRAYGLSGLQTRVALETIRTGNIRSAARRLSISYDTAREAMAEALKRAHAPRLPALVSRLTSLAFGVLPESDPAEVLGDLWGVTPRQADIAGLIADGLSRAEVAGALGLSEAVVKKEIDRVFVILQVSSAAALARTLVEAQALRWLTSATGGDAGFLDLHTEPLQFVFRPDGGRIAVSDYGPSSGRPVLVIHSSMTGRLVARRLRQALQAAGYRPISIDRPGFGLTDEWPGRAPGQHDPWRTSAEDTLAAMNHFKIARTDLVARGGAQSVLALHRLAPERLGRVVLVNPDPPFGLSGDGNPGTRIMKQLYLANPGLIRIIVALICRRYTFDRQHAAVRKAVQGSPSDEAAIAVPDIAVDYFRAQRALASGRQGGIVNEYTDFVRTPSVPLLGGTTDWRILVGAQDTMHDPDKVIAYWTGVLPDARIDLIADAGRLLAMSHPSYVVDALGAP